MKALVLVGPTAVGKTKLSLKIAGDYFKNIFEIISADSVQIYRHLDIGSGKLEVKERKEIPHHMIDICEPNEHFTASDFCEKAEKICNKIFERGNIPLFIGGTGLYINAFFEGLSKVPDFDNSIRDKLLKRLEREGLDKLYHELEKYDPVAAKKVHPNDKQRIIRGLEVYFGTGNPLSYYWGNKNGFQSEETLYIGIKQESEILYSLINNRVDEMIVLGLLEEVKQLKSNGYSIKDKALNSIGYAELLEYLNSKLTYEDAINKIKKETRKYAKRQMIWFKKNKNIIWYQVGEEELIKKKISSWLKIDQKL